MKKHQSSLMPKSTAILIQIGTSRSHSRRVSFRFLGLLGMANDSRSLAARSLLAPSTTTLDSACNTACGVPAGAKSGKPPSKTKKLPLMPCSCKVGTSGNLGERSGPVTPIGRTPRDCTVAKAW